MAQLRQDYQVFVDRSTEVVVVGPDNQNAFEDYFRKHKLPFIGIADPKHQVLKTYGQQIKIFKFGRMPAQAIIDQAGIVRWIHYGHEMSDIPGNEEILGLLDELGVIQSPS
ncbi:MAG: redoxin domain-containing protein [Anaerolineales bacterium]|nr:MAG: redoxin domain-containing protein [Anaerolineales bacterium]